MNGQVSPSPGPARWGRHILLVGVLLVGLIGAGARQPARAAGQPRYFEATRLTMAGEFTNYFDAYGGLPVFGYPITAARQEGGHLVQYFERERMEYHPENAGTPYEVLLGRLGAELTTVRGAEPAFARLPAPPPLPGDRRWVPETGHTLGGRFATYWDSHGALPILGYPISEEIMDHGYLTQWFERARLEYHPQNKPPYEVLLGLLGREVTDTGDPSSFDVSFTVAAGPPHNRRLTVGIAQGGESSDPAFLQNVVPQTQRLQVPLIRIDNIFNHYNVVERDAGGKLVYHFDQLDQVVDTVRAAGAQPYMCLDYVPPALAGGQGPNDPPPSYDEWRELVYQTVKHFNGDRGLGIKYWEVWNEPNLSDSWTGSYVDYLRLYDASRDGIVAADPTALVGGPTTTPLDPTAPDWLLGWEEGQGSKGRVDFISWHAFGRAPENLEAEIATVKDVVAKHPAFHPELIISEFSVATGGPNDTSQGGRSDGSGAGAFALTTFTAMEHAGLDKGLVFELKDSKNSQARYWGRWGMLTYDGQAKPLYYALEAYQRMRTGQLPVQLTTTTGTGVDLLVAQGADGVVRLLLWSAGVVPHRAHILLPPDLADRTYRMTVFDSAHNNFAAQGDDHLTPGAPRRGDEFLFDLEPDSFVILESP